jgi:opacity protein-like surface antigen
MKKTLVSICLLSTISTCSYGLGFYGGVALSSEQAVIKSERVYPYPYPKDSNPQKRPTESLALSTIKSGIILGYVHDFGSSRWGIDGHVDMKFGTGRTTANAINWFNSYHAEETYSMRADASLSLAVRYLLTDKVHLYFGPTFSRAKFSISPGSGGGGYLGVSTAASSTSKGYGFTLGTELPLLKHLQLRLSYSAIHYSAMTFEAIEPIAKVNLRQKISPTMQAFELGLIYRM